jgi:type II secretory pathway component PulM
VTDERVVDLTAYRGLLRDSRARRLLAGLATILLAVVSLLVWPREPASGRRESLDRELTET